MKYLRFDNATRSAEYISDCNVSLIWPILEANDDIRTVSHSNIKYLIKVLQYIKYKVQSIISIGKTTTTTMQTYKICYRVIQTQHIRLKAYTTLKMVTT